MNILGKYKQQQITPLKDTGYFFLLLENARPYAVASPNEVIMALSQVGYGFIGLIANENNLQPENRIFLKDFFRRVSKNAHPIIVEIDDVTISSLEERLTWKNSSQILAVWNPHQSSDEVVAESLLSLVYKGLKLIIGFNPWSSLHPSEKSRNNVLIPYFDAAGLWPSSKTAKLHNARVLRNTEYESMPLSYLLDHALSNIKSLLQVSDIISNILFHISTDSFTFNEKYKELNLKVQKLYSEYIHFTRAYVPCVAKPILKRQKWKRKLLKIINSILLYPLGNTFTAPGVSFYPGTVDLNSIPTHSVKLSMNLQFSNEIVHLGYYLPAGQRIEITSWIAKSATCILHLNYNLFDIWNHESWNKWPKTSMDFKIKSGETQRLSFAFGGLLSLSCQENHEIVDLSLLGVVEVPTFDSRERIIPKTWKTLRNHRVPWIILGNDVAVFVLPFIATRNLFDPTSIMEVWNFLIKQELHLKGFEISKHRRQLISADIQIIDGYMHSGYPIGTGIEFVVNPQNREDYLLDVNYIRKHGKWGLLHEIGHNIQDPLFTFEGTDEVTNNIFTLVATETLTGISSWSSKIGWVSKGYLSVFVEYIKGGQFKDWKLNPFLALGCYAQLKNSFGWELYRQVFRRYNVLAILHEKRNTNITDDGKIQLWIRETSKIAKMNLCPFFELWRIPVNKETKLQLERYPAFLPQDFLTDIVNETVNKIILRNGGFKMIQRKPIPIKNKVGDLRNPSKIEGKASIFRKEILQAEHHVN